LYDGQQGVSALGSSASWRVEVRPACGRRRAELWPMHPPAPAPLRTLANGQAPRRSLEHFMAPD
jgi:hypothetical protein